jgi:hypothetical protein
MRDIVTTNGEVSYTRRIRIGEFEHKEATVRLSFTLPEDMEDMPAAVARFGETVVARVEGMLGLATPTTTAQPADPANPRQHRLPPGVTETIWQEVRTDQPGPDPADMEPI